MIKPTTKSTQQLLLILILLGTLLLATVSSSSQEDDTKTNTDSTIIIEELETYLQEQVEPTIERYLEWKRQELKTQTGGPTSMIGPDCLEYSAGRLLRHRCCVVYSNLAAALIYGKYGVMDGSTTAANHPNLADLQQLRTYHDAKANEGTALVYHPQEMDVLLRIWSVNNLQRSGIYQANVQIAGVDLILSKCEFMDTHTFLTLSNGSPSKSDDDINIIVDMSWKQLPLMAVMAMDEAIVTDHERKEKAAEDLAAVLKEQPEFLVMPQDASTTTVISETSIQSILQQANLWNDPTAFPLNYKMIAIMYGSEMINLFCGKTNEEVRKEQEEREKRAAQVRDLHQNLKLLQPQQQGGTVTATTTN